MASQGTSDSDDEYGSQLMINFGLVNNSFYGLMSEVKKCIKKGADLEYNEGGAGMLEGTTALEAAAQRGHLHIVDLLVKKGCKLDGSALRCAAFSDRPEVCEYLIERGLDPEEKTSYYGQSALTGYGRWVGDNIEDRPARAALTEDVKEQRRQLLKDARAAWVIAEALRLKRLRNWKQRMPFLLVLTGCDFQPLAARKAQLLLNNPPLPTDVALPPHVSDTRLTALIGAVFSHPGMWKMIASYI